MPAFVLRLLLLVGVTVPLIAEVVALDLPRVWNGTTVKTSAGNPAPAKDMPPIWRLDRVWPDDYLNHAHWEPMIWSGERWEAKDHMHGGQPAARIDERGRLTLSYRAPHEGHPGHKLAALVLIAPTTATYGFAGMLHHRRWAGSGQGELIVLRRETVPSKRVVEITRIALPEDGEVKMEAILVPLKAGQELAFLPRLNRHGDAATLTFVDVQIAARR